MLGVRAPPASLEAGDGGIGAVLVTGVNSSGEWSSGGWKIDIYRSKCGGEKCGTKQQDQQAWTADPATVLMAEIWRTSTGLI